MANISTAQGTAKLKGSSESILAFLELAQHTESWDYGTMFDETEREDIIAEQRAGKHTSTEVTLSFFGCGRWNYETSLRGMMLWLNYDRTEKERWSDIKEKAWHVLELNPITAEFDYFDYDDSEFLVKEKTTVTWAANKIDKPIVKIIEQENHESTAENLSTMVNANVYDYSAFTVAKIKNELTVDNWVSELKNSSVSHLIDEKSFKQSFDVFTQELSASLDKQRMEQYNSLWYESSEWFADETILEIIEDILDKPKK